MLSYARPLEARAGRTWWGRGGVGDRRFGRGSRLGLLAVVATLFAASCGPTSGPKNRASGEPEPLRVLAASSLTEVVGEIEKRYGKPLRVSFGSSSALARQIRDGAPADVFLSASPQWLDFLRQADALDGEPVRLAGNRLAVVAADGSRLVEEPPQNLAELLERLAPGDGVAIADAGVPAGEYARAALRQAGLLESYASRLVGQSDVRAALHLAEKGELPAAFVYATDAAIADVQVLWTLGEHEHPPIEYQAASLRAAEDREAAREFLAYLRGETVRSLLLDSGFLLP